MDLPQLLSLLPQYARQLAAGYAVVALLAGGLGILNRVLGQKQGDKPTKAMPENAGPAK